MKKINKNKIIGVSILTTAFFALVFVLTPKNIYTPAKNILVASSSTSSKIPQKNVPNNFPQEKQSNVAQTSSNSYEHNATLKINDSVYILGFNSNESLFDSMQHQKDSEKITFESKNYSGIGQFIYSINGIKSDGSNYWIYYINGNEAQIGVSSYKLKDNDQIEWKFEKSK